MRLVAAAAEALHKPRMEFRPLFFFVSRRASSAFSGFLLRSVIWQNRFTYYLPPASAVVVLYWSNSHDSPATSFCGHVF